MGHSVVTSSLMKSEILVNANTKYTNMRVNVPGVIYVKGSAGTDYYHFC
mgnify:CR=1 FL=1